MPEADTSHENEADDVAASVAAAIDQLEAIDEQPSTEPPKDEPPAETIAEAATEEQPRPEDTDIVPRETVEEQPAEQPTEAPVEQPAETIDYPEHWDKAYKAEFDELPNSGKQFLIKRHKEMEADHTRKTMDIADFKREYEPIDQMMRAFAPMMQQSGIGPGGLIRRWAQAESYLNSQPEQAIKQLANHYGVDLAAIAYDDPAQQQDTEHGNQVPQPDPQVQFLSDQVNNLTTQQNLQQVNAFADEVGPDGNKLRPYFDEVAQIMAQDHKAARMLGINPPSLQELYDQACWKTPAVRDKLMSAQTNQVQAQTQQAAQEAAEAARKKAQQARQAGRSISGDAGSNAEPAPEYKTVEEAAAAAFDKHMH